MRRNDRITTMQLAPHRMVKQSSGVSKTLEVRVGFATRHIMSAALLCRSSAAMERIAEGKATPAQISENQTYVTAAVFAAIAFLEAANEFYSDAAEDRGNIRYEISAIVARELGDMWVHVMSKSTKFRLFEKYQIALALAQKPQFAPCEAPYRDVTVLNQLRNSLVHSNPSGLNSMASMTCQGSTISKGS